MARLVHLSKEEYEPATKISYQLSYNLSLRVKRLERSRFDASNMHTSVVKGGGLCGSTSIYCDCSAHRRGGSYYLNLRNHDSVIPNGECLSWYNISITLLPKLHIKMKTR